MVSAGWNDCQIVYPKQEITGGFIWKWIAPILLTPCLQHWIVSAVSAVLCVVLLLSYFYIQKNLRAGKSKPRASLYYWTKLGLTGFVAVILLASAALKCFRSKKVVDVDAEEISLSLYQFLSWFISFLLIKRVRDCAVERYMLSIRIKWVMNSLLSLFFVGCILLRVQLSVDSESRVNWVPVAVTCPVSLYLLGAALNGKTGVLCPFSPTDGQNGHLTEPLLDTDLTPAGPARGASP